MFCLLLFCNLLNIISLNTWLIIFCVHYLFLCSLFVDYYFYAFINDFETNINSKISKLKTWVYSIENCWLHKFLSNFSLGFYIKTASPKSSLFESKGNGRVHDILFTSLLGDQWEMISLIMKRGILPWEEHMYSRIPSNQNPIQILTQIRTLVV